MKKIKISEVKKFIQKNIETFHKSRLKCLKDTKLKDLLKKKNPYLFKAKNIITAQDLVISFLEARLSSSEEKIFGDFLEDLAIFVAKKTLSAVKSSSPGLDIEYTSKGVRYLVSVKSGLNWGNSSQWKALESNFKATMKVLKQSKHAKNVECILGISYGKQKRSYRRGIILQICGQDFWYTISGEKEFYTKIIKPLGHQAKKLNTGFNTKKAQIINKFTKELLNEFCDNKGKILWEDLVKFNSGNL